MLTGIRLTEITFNFQSVLSSILPPFNHINCFPNAEKRFHSFSDRINYPALKKMWFFLHIQALRYKLATIMKNMSRLTRVETEKSLFLHGKYRISSYALLQKAQIYCNLKSGNYTKCRKCPHIYSPFRTRLQRPNLPHQLRFLSSNANASVFKTGKTRRTNFALRSWITTTLPPFVSLIHFIERCAGSRIAIVYPQRLDLPRDNCIFCGWCLFYLQCWNLG